MDATLLQLVLGLLAFALAGNIWLTLAVLRASRRERLVPDGLAAGQDLPLVTAKRLDGGARFQPGTPGQAAVLLFLASRCPKCQAKLASIQALLPLADAAGLAIWLISEESPRRLRAFLPSAALQAATARVSLRDYRQLNPLMSSPSYLFINHQGQIDAVGLVGDADWQSLTEQLAPEARAGIVATEERAA